ncbi:1,4-alpha-glucan branching enzyme, partial [Streptomyces sp. NPDC056730]
MTPRTPSDRSSDSSSQPELPTASLPVPAPAAEAARAGAGAGTGKSAGKKGKKPARRKAPQTAPAPAASPATAASPAAAGSATAGAKKPGARTAPRPRVEPGGGRRVRAARPLDDGDRERLLSGSHHDPHGLLGVRPVPDGVLFRTLRPYARAVTVVTEEPEVRAALNDDGDGFFSGVLPLRAVPSYTLLVRYSDATQELDELEVRDPYGFLPALGDVDLHLIGEGRHEELWKALGARIMTHQGVTGTRFTVWAPNARGVRIAGDFNYC